MISKYNEKYKIKFTKSPESQCILGQLPGWMLVYEAYIDSREYKQTDEVEFTYNNLKSFNKLFKHIENKLNKKE